MLEPAAPGKYNRFWGSLRIGLNGIVGFSRYPLQVISLLGLAFFVFAMLLGLTYLILEASPTSRSRGATRRS